MSTRATPPEGLGPGYVRLVVLAGLIGVPSALVAALFLALVHDLEHWLWSDLPGRLGESGPPWYLVIGLPMAGAAIVVAARSLLPGDGGTSPLEGLHAGSAPLSHAPGAALAALATLSFGGVLGPEMPVVALGSAVGVALVSLVRADDSERAVASSAGSFSAVSALLSGPLVAGVFLTESGVGLGAALIPALLPGFVAAAVGYLIFVGFGDWGGLDAPGVTVPDLPLYAGTHATDLLIAIVIGVVTAGVATTIRGVSTRMAAEGARRLSWPLLLIGGGFSIGLIAVVADALGAHPEDVLFSGQASIPALVTETSTWIVLLLIVAKGCAYAISLACGFRGGPIFPAIFLGIGIATLAVVWFGMSPTVAVATGTAAGMAAQSRLLLTSILLAALLVGSHGLDAVPAAVLAAAAAWMATTARDRPQASTPSLEVLPESEVDDAS